MRRTRITDQLTFFEPDNMRAFKACAGVMVRGTRKLAIDTSMGAATIPMLLEEKPSAALISHYHLDHSLWGIDVLAHTDAEVWVPSGEDRYLTDRQFFLDQTAGPHGLADSWRRFSVDECGFHGLTNCNTYDAGNSFSDNSITIECIDTRGHSPAHCSFYFPADKVLFTGDLGVDRFGPWFGWTDCDLEVLVMSILVLRGLPVDILLTSHGGMMTSGIRDAWDLALARLLGRETIVAEGMEKGLSPEAIVAKGIFFPQKKGVPEPMRSFLTMWDRNMFDHHRKMIEAGGLKQFFPELNAVLPGSAIRKESM